LARWLRDPQSVKPGTAMPNLNLKAQEIADLVAYLQTLK
jgi:nitric oxide reductase subunit C